MSSGRLTDLRSTTAILPRARVAAFGIAKKIDMLPMNTALGLAQGMVPLVAYNYAAKKYDRMFAYVKETRKRGIIVSIVSLVLYETFATALNRFFISDIETVTLGAAFLKRRAVAAMFMFLSFYMIEVKAC